MKRSPVEGSTGAAFNPYARRCEAKSKGTGKRCKNPARVGYAVCAMHGAGYRKKPGGRPPRHGLRFDPGVVLSRLKKQKTGVPITDSLHALALASAQLDLAIEELLRWREAGQPLPLETYGYIIELCDIVGRNAERVAKTEPHR